MTEFLQSIDNRELAVSLWLFIVLCFCLVKREARSSILSLIKAFCARTILIMLGAMVVYFAAVVVLLSFVGLWYVSQLKLSLLWIITAGVSSLFVIPKIHKDKNYLRRAVRRNFKLSVLLDFFINLHSMPLIAELLFVPIATVLAAVLAYSEAKDEYENAQVVATRILSTFGIGLFIYTLAFVATHFTDIATADNARSLVLPILFSLTLLPFLWTASIYTAYEEVFVRLQFTIDNRSLYPYIKYKLILNFCSNTELLDEWLKNTWRGSITTKDDVDKSIRKVNLENGSA